MWKGNASKHELSCIQLESFVIFVTLVDNDAANVDIHIDSSFSSEFTRSWRINDLHMLSLIDLAYPH